MLDSLDTLIAFVLIMLVVSLLITIVVQMCAALLNLRGWNLLTGLKSTFAVIAPSLGADKDKLAGYLLKGELLSDSFLPNSFLDKWKNNRLASKLASFLNHWRHSSAIRPDELFDAIHRIATTTEPADATLKENARTLLAALGVSKTTLADAEARIQEAQKKAETISDDAKKALKGAGDLGEQVKQMLTVAGLNQDTKNRLNALQSEIEKRTNEIQKAFETQIKSVTEQVQAFGTATADRVVSFAADLDVAYQKFHYWTCICEERAQQWLTMHTRILTVIFAVFFAFGLQLDTVEIFKLVSTNKPVRDKLVAQAGAVETQAARVLINGNVLQDALKTWSDQETNPDVKKILAGIQVKDTDTRGDVQKEVDDALKDKKPSNTFDSMVTAAAKKRADELSGELGAVKADLDDTGFVLFPKGSRWKDGWSFSHVIGVLFSVGLLSLGAPFWYHALKDLVSLRSQVAQNIAEQKGKGGADAKPPEAPPTVKPRAPSLPGGAGGDQSNKPEKPETKSEASADRGSAAVGSPPATGRGATATPAVTTNAPEEPPKPT